MGKHTAKTSGLTLRAKTHSLPIPLQLLAGSLDCSY